MPLDEDQKTSKIARCFLRFWGPGFGGFGGLGFRAQVGGGGCCAAGRVGTFGA